MKISKITLKNFRQFYGEINVDLRTNGQQNIVVVGGLNGYGKTNLLLSIVWCLYGDKISQVDDNFRNEIQKEKNYSLFMKQSINWTAKKEKNEKFSVELLIDDLMVPAVKGLSNSTSKVTICREFEVSSMREKLSILDSSNEVELFEDDIDKINFINDFIIPLEAAKFVFFDAEKIAEIANLSTKDEGNFINDALSKILGLDIYETLINDLELYINNLKKEGASKNLQEQIIDKEKAIEISQSQIAQFEEENAEAQKRIDDLKKKVRNYQNVISQHSKKGNTGIDRNSVVAEIDLLKNKEKELQTRFNELSEILPIAILTGKIEEVNDHLQIQEQNKVAGKNYRDNLSKIESFIEKLFNHPPEPENSTLTLKDKMFYYNKATELGAELYNEESEFLELPFEHDLNNSEKDLVTDSLNLINQQSKELLETTISDFNTVKNQLLELNQNINTIDADLEDELILEYISKKEKTDREIGAVHENIGTRKGEIDKLKTDISRLNQSYQLLLKRVEINELNRQKIEKCNEYLEVLNVFVYQQKELKKESLERNILSEMQKLMHKLDANDNQFIDDVKVTILAEGNGMKITLYNSEDEEVKKEILSQGEKQLYISSLIKAILCEAVQSLPIFIDTPLGRMDDEHINNILLYFYPDLSEQVVLLSTNNEITPKRYKDISPNVSASYLLINDGSNTIVNKGYFQGYEN